MSDYFSRLDIPAVDGVGRVGNVAAMSVNMAQSGRSGIDRGDGGTITAADLHPVDENDLAGAAEYVRIYAQISDILSDLRSNSIPLSVEEAAGSIQALMHTPVVMVPLPPASKEAVEQAASFAKKMVARALFTHAAQSHVSRSTTDFLLSRSA